MSDITLNLLLSCYKMCLNRLTRIRHQDLITSLCSFSPDWILSQKQNYCLSGLSSHLYRQLPFLFILKPEKVASIHFHTVRLYLRSFHLYPDILFIWKNEITYVSNQSSSQEKKTLPNNVCRLISEKRTFTSNIFRCIKKLVVENGRYCVLQQPHLNEKKERVPSVIENYLSNRLIQLKLNSTSPKKISMKMKFPKKWC